MEEGKLNPTQIVEVRDLHVRVKQALCVYEVALHIVACVSAFAVFIVQPHLFRSRVVLEIVMQQHRRSHTHPSGPNTVGLIRGGVAIALRRACRRYRHLKQRQSPMPTSPFASGYQAPTLRKLLEDNTAGLRCIYPLGCASRQASVGMHTPMAYTHGIHPWCSAWATAHRPPPTACCPAWWRRGVDVAPPPVVQFRPDACSPDPDIAFPCKPNALALLCGGVQRITFPHPAEHVRTEGVRSLASMTLPPVRKGRLC